MSGPRNGMFVNTSGNVRDGEAFVLVKRKDHELHIYGTGKDRRVIVSRLPADDGGDGHGASRPDARRRRRRRAVGRRLAEARGVERRRDRRLAPQHQVGHEPRGRGPERDAPGTVPGRDHQVVARAAQQRPAVRRSAAARRRARRRSACPRARARSAPRAPAAAAPAPPRRARRAGRSRPATRRCGGDQREQAVLAAAGEQRVDARLLERVAGRLGQMQLDVDAPQRGDRPPAPRRVDQRGRPRPGRDHDHVGADAGRRGGLPTCIRAPAACARRAKASVASAGGTVNPVAIRRPARSGATTGSSACGSPGARRSALSSRNSLASAASSASSTASSVPSTSRPAGSSGSAKPKEARSR